MRCLSLRTLSIAEHLTSEMIESLKTHESTDSFASFLRKLMPASADYWPQVYQRLGLDYPSEPAPPSKCDLPPIAKKAWWRFW